MSQSAVVKSKSKISEKFKAKKIEVLNETLPAIIKYLSRYLRKINDRASFENPDEFEDFGPVLLSEEEDKHSKRIKYAIDNPEILNLALTGPMGSGKSTILKTFEYNYKQYKCLNISLATFDKKILDTDKIEHNILKQLFYSVEHKKIPESRFKRIENLKGIKFKTFLFILWLCSISYFLKFELFNELKVTLHLNVYSGFLSFIYGLYFIGYSCVLIFKLMNFILNFKLTKFKIKDVDFDNNQDKKTINFENEIDEILYFFERNAIDIVFFQDLDRFDESEIFIKLREINSLINNYEPIKKQRKITFIYAVCDDIFKENERAKFFDFIIPVIPVINYTSSSSKLLSKLREDITNKKLSKDFIDDVSLFLNDYRTIKSIFNEYQIYKSIIGSQLENYNNLLAMMIYKNIEPTDFDKLNLNQGYVFSILENSKELTAEKIQKFKNRTTELNSKIEDTKEEKLKDVRELRMIYILKFFELILVGNTYSVFGISLAGEKLTIEQLLTDEYFDLFKKEVNIIYYYNTYYTNGSSISFAELEQKVDKLSYAKRLEIVLNKQTENLNRIKIELQEIENNQKELGSKKLHEILDSNNSAAYFEKHSGESRHINNFKLINYLLSGGYINEDYNHYISHFHPGSITKEDNEFLLSLLPSEKPLPYHHKLKELNSLIKRIKTENFSKEAILNLSLVDYLIENKKTGKLNQVATLLSKANPKTMGFIDDYLNYADEEKRALFFKTLNENWNGLWIYLIAKSNFTADKIETYLVYIFSYLDQTTIRRIDLSGKLSEYLGGFENLACFHQNGGVMEAFQEFLEKSSVKFENLIYNRDQKTLFEFIYNNDLYAINEKMIELFISNFKADNTDISNLQTANYTTIKNSGKSQLIKYIDEHLEFYLNNVFLKLENNSEESQDNICAILNNDHIDNRFDIVEHGKFSVADLSKIDSTELQAALLIYKKVDTVWENVLAYYKNIQVIDDTLVDYLNLEGNYKVLSKLGLIKDSDKTVLNSFPKDLINSAISDESFSKLTYNLPFSYPNGAEFSEVSESKMKSLIKSKRILLSTDNYELIKEKFKNLKIFLLETNAEEFVKNVEKYTIESSLIHEILFSQDFSPSQILAVIENTSDEVLSENNKLLVKLGEFLSVNEISTISFILLNHLLANAPSNLLRVELTNKYFTYIEDDNLTVVIEQIEDFSKLILGKHPKVANTSMNQQLIKNLEGKLISKTKTSDDNKQIELFPYLKPRI